MKQRRLHRPAILLVIFMAAAVVGTIAHKSESASLTSTSITMTNPRLSWSAELDGSNTAGATTLLIDTTVGAAPSTSSAGLQNNDTITINANSYVIEDIIPDTNLGDGLTSLSLDTPLDVGDVADGTPAYSPQTTSMIAGFTTVSAINGGSFRVLVPAAPSNDDDGVPDQGFWDFNNGTAAVNCPSDIGAEYDFPPTGTATANDVTINGQLYHSFVCDYTGAGDVGTNFTTTPTNKFTITGLINPAPQAAHTIGTADSHRMIVQHLDSTDAVVDSTTVSVGVIESVRVTATVDPQLTFRIIGLGNGTSACGITTDVTTTPSAVPFGSLSIDTFTEAAQALTVSTNAANGFVVTAIEDDQLSKNGDGCTNETPTTTTDSECIQDAFQNLATASETTSADWTGTAQKGFGFSLHDVNGSTTEAFAYNESGRTFSTRHFADAQDSSPEAPQTIFSGTGVADNQNLYVCYRVLPDVTTEAGNYENNITYRATATF